MKVCVRGRRLTACIGTRRKGTHAWSEHVSPDLSQTFQIQGTLPLLGWKRPFSSSEQPPPHNTSNDSDIGFYQLLLQKERELIAEQKRLAQSEPRSKQSREKLPQIQIGGGAIAKSIKQGSLKEAVALFKKHPDASGARLLISAYGRAKDPDAAFDIYNIFLSTLTKSRSKIVDREVWNDLMFVCVNTGQYHRCPPLLHDIQRFSIPLNHTSFKLLALSATVTKDLATADELYRIVVKRGKKQFGWLDVSDWTQLLQAWAKGGRVRQAMEALRTMTEWGVSANVRTYASLAGGCTDEGDLEAGRKVFEHMKRHGVEPDRVLGNTLIWMFGRLGDLPAAIEVYSMLKDRNFTTFNAMMTAYTLNGDPRAAVKILDEINLPAQANIFPATIISGLKACAGVPDLAKGQLLHKIIAHRKIPLTEVGPALMVMYGRCGRFEKAFEVFEDAVQESKQSEAENEEVKRLFDTMVMVCGQHEKGETALEVLDKMNASGIKPSALTYLGALGACSTSKMVEEGMKLLNEEMPKRGIEPNILHYNCVVDLLARSGMLDEAEKFIQDMPSAPNDATWIILAAASRLQGDTARAEKASAQLSPVTPNTPEAERRDAELLLGDLFALVGGRRWDDGHFAVSQVAKELKHHKDDVDRTWVECCGGVYSFGVAAPGEKPTTAYLTDSCEHCEGKHSENRALELHLHTLAPDTPVKMLKKVSGICGRCSSILRAVARKKLITITFKDSKQYHQFK